MNPLDLLDHLLNFAAPALWVGLLVAVFDRWLMRRTSAAGPGLWLQAGVNSMFGLLALSWGLWLFGRDGKMASYFAMLAACATSQWLLRRGWRR